MTAGKAFLLSFIILMMAYILLALYMNHRMEKRQKEFKDRLNKW